MSIPIKETPILRSKDARRFAEKIRRNEREPAPREEYDNPSALDVEKDQALSEEMKDWDVTAGDGIDDETW
jgi:hypothetical protein